MIPGIPGFRFKGDPILSQVAEPVTMFDKALEDLAASMLRIQHKANGIGLAAPQVGRSIRMIVVGQDVLVNPVIRKRSAEVQYVDEVCLSVPGKKVRKVRAKRVNVDYQGVSGDARRMRAQGFMAAVVQHEIDHLQGILITDP